MKKVGARFALGFRSTLLEIEWKIMLEKWFMLARFCSRSKPLIRFSARARIGSKNDSVIFTHARLCSKIFSLGSLKLEKFTFVPNTKFWPFPSNAKNVTFSTFEVNVYKILGNFPEENHDGIIWCMPKKIVQSQSSKKRWATCDAELTLLQIRSLIKMRYQSPKHRQFCTFFLHL